jgi:hypothetical protein
MGKYTKNPLKEYNNRKDYYTSNNSDILCLISYVTNIGIGQVRTKYENNSLLVISNSG